MKFTFKSIRWRLQAWHGLLLLFVLTAFGLRSYYLARESRLTTVDLDLKRAGAVVVAAMPSSPLRASFGDSIRMALLGGLTSGVPLPLRSAENDFRQTNGLDRPFKRQIQEEYRAVSDRNEHAGFYYIVWQPDGAVLLSSSNLPPGVARPPAAAGARFHGRSRGEFREEYIGAAGGYQLLVGRSIEADSAALRRFAIQLALAGGVVLVLGLAGGWWLSTGAIRPIAAISRAAGKIAAGNLAERINVSETDSELGQLAHVLNSSFDQVQTAFNQLQAALQQQVQFTADASHELRTPVAVILAEANSALARERAPGEYREALEACQASARRMRRLTESLLTLARLDSGEQGGQRQPCDLQVVAQEAIQMLRPLAEERGVGIHAALSAGRCLGNVEQLGQVVTNLVSNAIQYNRPGGEVRVRVTSEGQLAILNVIDTGQGISAGDLPHIFERFYRADKSRSNANGHVGLGLAITKAIVEAHGGRISASSEIGAGSTFTVSLDRLPEPQAEA